MTKDQHPIPEEKELPIFTLSGGPANELDPLEKAQAALKVQEDRHAFLMAKVQKHEQAQRQVESKKVGDAIDEL